MASAKPSVGVWMWHPSEKQSRFSTHLENLRLASLLEFAWLQSRGGLRLPRRLLRLGFGGGWEAGVCRWEVFPKRCRCPGRMRREPQPGRSLPFAAVRLEEQRSLHCSALPWASPPRALAGRWDGCVSVEFQLFPGKYLSIEIEELWAQFILAYREQRVRAALPGTRHWHTGRHQTNCCLNYLLWSDDKSASLLPLEQKM